MTTIMNTYNNKQTFSSVHFNGSKYSYVFNDSEHRLL